MTVFLATELAISGLPQRFGLFDGKDKVLDRWRVDKGHECPFARTGFVRWVLRDETGAIRA